MVKNARTPPSFLCLQNEKKIGIAKVCFLMLAAVPFYFWQEQTLMDGLLLDVSPKQLLSKKIRVFHSYSNILRAPPCEYYKECGWTSICIYSANH